MKVTNYGHKKKIEGYCYNCRSKVEMTWKDIEEYTTLFMKIGNMFRDRGWKVICPVCSSPRMECYLQLAENYTPEDIQS